MNFKKIRWLSILIMSSFFLISCSQEIETWRPISADKKIKIAILGDDEYIKDNGTMDAIELATSDFYHKTGFQIETEIYDDDADYNKGIAYAKQIAEDMDIAAVLVKQELDYIDATAEIFNDAQKPFIITNGCYESTIDKAYEYMIVDCINADIAGNIMGEYVINQGYQYVAFCHSDTKYEEDELKGFQAKIEGSSVTLADTMVGPYTQEEFDIAYARWTTLGINAVCISNYDILNSDLVRMLREKNSDIKVIGDYVMDSDEDIAVNGEFLEGTAIIGMYLNDWQENDSTIMQKFQEKYGMEMSERAIQSYDIVYLLGEGVISGITEPKELLEYIKLCEYDSIAGVLKFDENGCLIPNGNEMLLFRDGIFQ